MILQFVVVAFQVLQTSATFSIENKLDLPRQEVVSIPMEKIEQILGEKTDPAKVLLEDKTSNQKVLIQWVDENQDGQMEEMLFWANLKENEIKSYKISLSLTPTQTSEPDERTFARFVPERIDDIAWENDKVAFRTYGPEAERIVVEKKPGGTLTSGIDAWLKRVSYPIIDKWYQKHVAGGSYHQDTGEGYDPYHVGDSRGIGGIGVWLDDSLYVSRNFTEYKILANGPLRTIIQLNYAPWKAGTITVKETKKISIDLGSQFYHMEEFLESDEPLPNVTTGITLHEGKGKAYADATSGWISYWETIDDAQLGTGIVTYPAHILEQFEHKSLTKDQSHSYLSLDPRKKVSYFAGFGWEKAGEFSSAAEWNLHLTQFSRKLLSPLTVTFN